MNKNIISLFLSIFIFFTANLEAGNKTLKSEPFEIIFPADKSVFDQEYATIVIKKLDSALKEVNIVVNGEPSIIFKTNDKERGIYCKSIKLKLGSNKILLVGYNKNGDLSNRELNIFHRVEVFEVAVEEPNGYKKNFFHNDKNEKLCISCHNMKKDKKTLQKHLSAKNEKEFDLVQNPEESNCYQCHNSITSKKNVHAPTVNYLCTECHIGQTAEFNEEDRSKSKYLAPDPIMNQCFNCHEGIGKKWFSNTSEHGPLRSGRCNKCHNPHSSDYEFFLRKPIWKLCTTCHSEKASGKHVIGSFVFGRNSGAHPTRGRPDPARPSRELVCSSCHNPHGSNGVYLLRTKGKRPFSVCKRCHKK